MRVSELQCVCARVCVRARACVCVYLKWPLFDLSVPAADARVGESINALWRRRSKPEVKSNDRDLSLRIESHHSKRRAAVQCQSRTTVGGGHSRYEINTRSNCHTQASLSC